jgi:hypothetical protein
MVEQMNRFPFVSSQIAGRTIRNCQRSRKLRNKRTAGFQTCQSYIVVRLADLEIGDTAGLETCDTRRLKGCLVQ